MMMDFLKLRLPIKDEEFDVIYPQTIRHLSKRHFTPVEVAIKATEWLTENNFTGKILDIGSGSGKFCFIAAALSKSTITGVEYRKDHIDICNKIKLKNRLQNVEFIHSNINKIAFKNYDGFYFFNPFQEQIDSSAKIDMVIKTNESFYAEYEEYVKKELEKLPAGTKLVTYHTSLAQIPTNFCLTKTRFEGKLKLWIKTTNSISKPL